MICFSNSSGIEKRTKSNGRKLLPTMQYGGQKMLDIIALNKSLKIAWIVQYISDDCKSKRKTFWDFYLFKWGGKLVFLGYLQKI